MTEEKKRVDKIIDGLINGIETFADNYNDSDIAYCVVVYVRDTSDRTKQNPDGIYRHTSMIRGNYYDVAVFKEITKIHIDDFKHSREGEYE